MASRILLVDDHPVVLAGLRKDLSNHPDMEVVAEATGRESVFEAVRKLKPNIVLMDIHLGTENGIEISRQVLAKYPRTKIIIFSGDSDQTVVEAALQAGVLGYLLKNCKIEELLRAINLVLAGRLYMCPDVANQVFEDYKKVLVTRLKEKPSLTEHETYVLKLLSEGLRNKTVAAKLGVTPKAVERTRSRIMAKLGYCSLAELARYAAREGIVPK